MPRNTETFEVSFSRRQFLSSTVATGMGLYAMQSRAQAPLEDSQFNRVHVNQVGYLPEEPKRAVVPLRKPLASQTFQLMEEKTGGLRYTGELTQAKHSHAKAPERDWIADFTPFRRPGRYHIRLADGTVSPPFEVNAVVYAPLFPLMESFFDIQQCGSQSSAQRKPCHLDDGIIQGGPRNGQPLDATGGWHDAGDYLKFVETTSYAVALMLFACDLRPQLLTKSAGAGGQPPLLAHAKVGLDWLLKMHPTPKEFYYQVGDKSDHEHWRLPQDDSLAGRKAWHARPVFFGIGANLAGRTAAAFAMASRLYKRTDPAFAARCLVAAQSVFALGLKHPHSLSTQPHDFYPEENGDDDMEWGAAELFKATRNPDYLRQALAFADEVDVAGEQVSVYTTNALAHYTLYSLVTGENRETLLGYLRSDADRMRKRMQGAYGLATPYVWGTAEAATGVALTCLLYAQLSGDPPAAEVARRQRDYILGCNPFGLSCLIGAGTRFPQAPHHQIAAIGKFQLNGGVIAGPSSLEVFENQDFNSKHLKYSVPEKQVSKLDSAQVGVYQDSAQNYVINEPAIDYTAQFLLLTAFYLAKA